MNKSSYNAKGPSVSCQITLFYVGVIIVEGLSKEETKYLEKWKIISIETFHLLRYSFLKNALLNMRVGMVRAVFRRKKGCGKQR